MALGFQDPRVRVEITDGIKWVEAAAEGTYDAIIVDSSDPVGPAEVLFQKVHALAGKGGIVTSMTGSRVGAKVRLLRPLLPRAVTDMP